MGYRTPNLDRIAKEGAMFTDFYGQQSCTARHRLATSQEQARDVGEECYFRSNQEG